MPPKGNKYAHKIHFQDAIRPMSKILFQIMFENDLTHLVEVR